MERIYNSYGKTRAVTSADARICEKIDRFLESGGPQIIDHRFSYTDYLEAHCADQQAYQDALRVMGQEILAYVRALNRSPAQSLQGLQSYSARSQPAQVRTGAASGGGRKGAVAPPTVSRNGAGGAPSGSVLNGPAASDRPRTPPIESINVRNEVCALLADYLRGILPTPAHVMAAIQKKNWPPETIQAAQEQARQVLPPG